ncbi:MAG: sigma-70 family RNA polymerase sigma factor [Pseudomonadota bacterium]
MRRSAEETEANPPGMQAPARADVGPIDYAANADPRIRKLYEESLGELVAGLRRRFGDGPPAPDDVIQESFRRVFEQPDTSAISNLKAYVWRIARNLVLDGKKAAAVRSQYDFEVEQLFFPLRGDNLSPEIVITARAQLRAINELLLEMPAARRRALLLYRVEGLTLAKVAEEMGLSVSGVRKHVSRAQAQLHALFLDGWAD